MLAPPETCTAAEGRHVGESVISAGTSSNLIANTPGFSVPPLGAIGGAPPESRKGSTRGATWRSRTGSRWSMGGSAAMQSASAARYPFLSAACCSDADPQARERSRAA
eukprot:7459450-Pyramimonas_sp.AAC.1